MRIILNKLTLNLLRIRRKCDIILLIRSGLIRFYFHPFVNSHIFSFERYNKMTVLRVFSSFVCLSLLVAAPVDVLAQDAAAPEVVFGEEASTPDSGELNAIDKDLTKGSAATNSISAPSALQPIAEDEFFDANDLVPQGEMARTGPVKVNPSVQPASKLIIVKKNHKADSRTAQLVSAERAMKLGRYDSALELFDILYEKNRRDPRVLMGRAVVLQNLGRFDEAMGMYEKLSKIEPHNIEVKVNMLGLLSTRYPSVALRRLIDLHARNKSHVGLTAQIAISYANVGDMESAIKYLGVAASMEPENANHLFNMAVMADRSGDEKTAVSYYEKALEVDTIYGAGRTIPRETVYERLAQIR